MKIVRLYEVKGKKEANGKGGKGGKRKERKRKEREGKMNEGY